MSGIDDKVRAALHKNFLFASLAPGELDALSGALELRSFPENAIIVQEDDPADSLFLVIEGSVNVIKANGQFLAVLGQNGFFGEMGLFVEGSKRTAHCIAATPALCAVLDKQSLERFCEARPASGLTIMREIVRALSDRLRATSADLAMAMTVRPQAEVSSMVEAARKLRGG